MPNVMVALPNIGGALCSTPQNSATSFSPIDDMCLNCEDIARQSCAMVPRCRIFGDSLGPAFPAKQISYLHSKATPCVEVWQTSNLRRLRLGEEKRKKNKRQGKNIMVCPIP